MLSTPARVLIVDDSPVLREALRWAIDDSPDLNVVGEASEGQESLTLAAALRPDVVLLDIEMPGKDAFAVARALKAEPYPPLILFLSVHDEPSFRRKAAEAGGDGFAGKGLGWDGLIAQIRTLLNPSAFGP